MLLMLTVSAPVAVVKIRNGGVFAAAERSTVNVLSPGPRIVIDFLRAGRAEPRVMTAGGGGGAGGGAGAGGGGSTSTGSGAGSVEMRISPSPGTRIPPSSGTGAGFGGKPNTMVASVP